MGRPGIAVEVSASEREQLVSMSRSRSLPHSLVRRAKIVLMAAEKAIPWARPGGAVRSGEIWPPSYA